MYKLIASPFNQTQITSVVRVADNAVIPFDPANTDYREYLKWLADGNEPLPAEGALNG